MKIGHVAGMQKAMTLWRGRKKKEDKQSSLVDALEEEVEAVAASNGGESRRKWLAMMMTQSDGYSDPPGVKVRPVEGLHGIDFLAETAIAKKVR